MASVVSNITQRDEYLETYCLIWLDASVNESQENIQAQRELQTSINHFWRDDDKHVQKKQQRKV
jgi:hypothetical protein